MNCFLKPRPKEELYDVSRDPHELRNLAEHPEYAKVLARMRGELERWGKRTDDWKPEFEAPDEFDRETCLPLPVRHRPLASKSEMLKQFRENGYIK